MKVLALLNTPWTRVKIIILAALVVAMTAHAQSSAFTVHITIDGKSFALPFNQPLAAWTTIYGTGYHNPDIRATEGWTMAWSFQRVDFASTFTGKPLIATRISLAARPGQKPLSLEEATEMARSLRLGNKRVDPNMENDSSFLWTGDHLSLRYASEPEAGLEDVSFIDIWTDQDPLGGIVPPLE